MPDSPESRNQGAPRSVTRVPRPMGPIASQRWASWLATATGVLFVALSASRAGELHLQHLKVNDGLSQSHVETIIQDRDGYIWLGTASGLNRFDGHDVEVYKHDSDDAGSLNDDGVYALHVDAQGTMWVGTGGGLNRFVPQTDSFIHWKFDPSDPEALLAGGVSAITSDRAGMLWVGTDGLNRLDPRTGAVVRHPIGHALEPYGPGNPRGLPRTAMGRGRELRTAGHARRRALSFRPGHRDIRAVSAGITGDGRQQRQAHPA